LAGTLPISPLNLRIETKTCVQWRTCACAFSVTSNSRTVAGSMAPLDVYPPFERPNRRPIITLNRRRGCWWHRRSTRQCRCLLGILRARASPNLASLNRPAGNLSGNRACREMTRLTAQAGGNNSIDWDVGRSGPQTETRSTQPAAHARSRCVCSFQRPIAISRQTSRTKFAYDLAAGLRERE
jgi:hypothetical protein